MEKVKGIIIQHLGVWGYAFDIFVHESVSTEKWVEELREELYTVEKCPYVIAFLEKYKDYVYVGSEDLAHIEEFNKAVGQLINDLVNEGFKIRIVFSPEEV